MKKTRMVVGFALALAILATQVGSVFAAPTEELAPLTGTVQSITLETDINTVVTTVRVTILDGLGASITVRVSLETAMALGLAITDENGMPVINPAALGLAIQIHPATVIPDEEEIQHPVGSALATIFSDIDGLEYETIMEAHAEGTGFGVIAQALWLTKNLDGNYEVFLAIIEAKKTGDYGDFFSEDDTIPQNWGQFRKALLNGEMKVNLGAIMSEQAKDNGNNGNNNGDGNGKAGDNGNAGGNSSDNGKGKGQDNGKGKGKDK